MGGRTEGWTDERKSPCVLQDFVPFGAAAQKEEGRKREKKKRRKKEKKGKKSSKDHTWSAVPDALLGVIQ